MKGTDLAGINLTLAPKIMSYIVVILLVIIKRGGDISACPLSRNKKWEQNGCSITFIISNSL